MRTTVVPAQITTVEDKIAGNLNLTQILLFLGAIFSATILYVVLPPTYKLNPIKIAASLLAISTFTILAMRIKGKIILDWLLVLSNYNLRPKYYVFNKNDNCLRTLYLPEVPMKAKNLARKAHLQPVINPTKNIGIKDLVELDKLVLNKNLSFSFKTNKKGGLHVAFEQV